MNKRRGRSVSQRKLVERGHRARWDGLSARQSRRDHAPDRPLCRGRSPPQTRTSSSPGFGPRRPELNTSKSLFRAIKFPVLPKNSPVMIEQGIFLQTRVESRFFL